MRNADAVEIPILLEHLRHRLAQVSLRDLRGVARHVVVRVEVLLRDPVRLRELLAHEDAPEDDVGVESAFLGQAEDAAIQALPLRELRVRPLAGFRKILRPHHVRERMHRPQRDRVEAVLDHHVEEGLPVREVAHRVVVLVERRARAVRVPGRVELDRPQRERGFAAAGSRLPERRAVAQFVAQRQRAVDEPACVAAAYRDAARVPADREGFRAERARIDGQRDREVLRAARDRRHERRLDLAQCVRTLRRARFIDERDGVRARETGREEQDEQDRVFHGARCLTDARARVSEMSS